MNDGDDKMNQNLMHQIPPQGVHLHQHNTYNTYNNYNPAQPEAYPKRGIGDYLTDLFTGFQVYILLCILAMVFIVIIPAFLGYDTNELYGPNSLEEYILDVKKFFMYVLATVMGVAVVYIFGKLFLITRKQRKENKKHNEQRKTKAIQRYH
jgi:hypothetical protein